VDKADMEGTRLNHADMSGADLESVTLLLSVLASTDLATLVPVFKQIRMGGANGHDRICLQ
jgi:uncharacterized protein YjbI with pentapeptide repeats